MPERDEQTEAVGQRVRTVRKLRGLTQEQLASRAHVSLSLIKKVETGRVPATPYFVTSVARAMQVSIPELYGQATPRYGTERADVADLETAIMLGHVVASDGPAWALDELIGRAADMEDVCTRVQYDRMVAELPTLLADVHNALPLTFRDERRRAQRLLADVYRNAAMVLWRLGSDVAVHAADHGIRAAEHGEDMALASVIMTERCLPLMARGAYDHVTYLCHEARLALDVEARDTVESRSARGYAYLRSAIVTARTGDMNASHHDLDRAARLAAQIPPDANVHGTVFNVDNVAVHAASAAVEAGNGGEALRAAPPGPGLTVGRRASYHMDMARAYLLVGDRTGTLTELSTARDLAPQMVRYNPQVHESIRVLARTDRCRTDRLTDLARWAGVPV